MIPIRENSSTICRIHFVKLPLSKRLFDLFASISALIILSPILLIAAFVIRLESKGKIFYISKRVGNKPFDFYKLRSMRVGAEYELNKLAKDKNTYVAKQSAFIKIANDPRITKVGKFIRNTSIDELPQLINVIKGNMSIVGNRPLSVYEADLLIQRSQFKRFLAPAGITGLWQVELRGKGGVMSEEERIRLDNEYADHFIGNNYSFWYDLKLILRTFPALFQKDTV